MMISRLQAGCLLAALIATTPLFGVQTANAGDSPADNLYVQPVRLISVNGFRLSLYCSGKGSPAVIFDSGFLDWAPSWSAVQPPIARWTEVCSYDRAGRDLAIQVPCRARAWR